MATNCLVGGKVVCRDQPMAGVRVDIVLLNDSKHPTHFRTTTATDHHGNWAAAFDVEFDIAALSFAKISVHCNPPPSRIYLARLNSSLAGTASATLASMIENIGVAILSKVIGSPILTPILSTDFAFLVAHGRTVNCCPVAVEEADDDHTGGDPGTGSPGSVPATSTGNINDALRRAEEAARRAEAAAAEARCERELAEQERRRAEEERHRAEQDRRRTEDERRRAEEERRKAEAAREAAEATLAEAKALNRRRTRLCFDLKGTAASDGRAAISVGGRTSVVKVSAGDSAEEVLQRLGESLKFRGYEIDGPKRDPGTGEFILCVLSDAAGDDPRGGIIGSIDVRGFERTSVHREEYRPALAMARADPQSVRVDLGAPDQLASISTIELEYLTESSATPLVLRIDTRDIETAEQLAEQLMLQTEGLLVGVEANHETGITLEVGSLQGSDRSVSAIAVEVSGGADGVAVGTYSPRRLFHEEVDDPTG
jgi:hypothetical protein